MTNINASKWPDYAAAIKEWDLVIKQLPAEWTETHDNGQHIPRLIYKSCKHGFIGSVNMNSDANFSTYFYWYKTGQEGRSYFDNITAAMNWVIQTERKQAADSNN